MDSNSEKLQQYMGITGADQSEALSILEAFNWDLPSAINFFADNQSTSDFQNSRPHDSQPLNESTARDVIPATFGILSDQMNGMDYDDYDSDSDDNDEWPLEGNNALSSLFQRPADILFSGSFEEARFEAEMKKKWLMVNLQDPREFNCQVLNRDVFAEPTVKEVIMASFIFWQCNKAKMMAQKFITFYNVHSFPFIGVIDPVTGQEVFRFDEDSHRTTTFMFQIRRFLDTYKPYSSHHSGQNANQSNVTSRSKDDSSDVEVFHDAPLYISDIDSSNEYFSDSVEIVEDVKIITSDQELEDMGNTEKESQSSTSCFLPQGDPLNLLLRTPDGTRNQLELHTNFTMKQLFLKLREMEINVNDSELIFHQPPMSIQELDEKYRYMTLGELNVPDRSLIFLQYI